MRLYWKPHFLKTEIMTIVKGAAFEGLRHREIDA